MTTNEVITKLEDVTFDLVNEQLNTKDYFEYEFPNKDILFIYVEDGNFYQIGDVKYIEVAYGVFDGENIQVTNSELFSPTHFNKAINIFLERLTSENPHNVIGTSSSLEDIHYTSLQVKEILNQNNYNGDDNCKKMILDSLRVRNNFEFIFNNRNKLRISKCVEDGLGVWPEGTKCITIKLYSHTTLATPGRRNIVKEYFLNRDINLAIDVFIDKLKSNTPEVNSGKGKKFQDIEIINKEELCFHNYRDYLEVTLNPFWILVFGKTLDESNCSNIVNMNINNGWCYKEDMEAVDIPFQRGMLVYLLSCVKEMEVDISEAYEWIVDNHPKYLPLIEQAEKQVLKDIYGVVK